MFFVGNGEAGKTTLIHRLTTGMFLNGYEMTDGVKISCIPIGSIECIVFDFAGQEQYVFTHRLFFENEAMFIMLHNPRSSAENALLMYLEMVRNCAPRAPLLLVFSRADECPADADRIKASSSQILDTISIDSKSGTGIDELKTIIENTVLEKLPGSTKEVPKSFTVLQNVISKFANEDIFSISVAEFYRISRDEVKIEDESLIDLALSLFCCWGFIYLLCGNEIVLRPQALADVLACVFTKKPETLERMGPEAREGILLHSNSIFEAIWGSLFSRHLWELQEVDGDTRGSAKPAFLDLLYRAGLAYELFDPSGSPLGSSLVPALLPERPVGLRENSRAVTADSLQDHFFPAEALKHSQLILSCDSQLPVSFIARLQVELRSIATLGGLWKRGGLYATRNNTEISYGILLQISDNRVEIMSAGDSTATRSYIIEVISKLLEKEFISVKLSIEVSFDGVSWKEDYLRRSLREKGYIEFNSNRIWLHGFAKLIDSSSSSSSSELIPEPDALSGDIEELLPASIQRLQVQVTSLETLLKSTQDDGDRPEIDSVGVEIALEDSVRDILSMTGVRDAGAVKDYKSHRGRPLLYVLFLPVRRTRDGAVSMYAISPGPSRSSPWILKTDCQVSLKQTTTSHSTLSSSSSSKKLQILKDLLVRTFAVLRTSFGDEFELADLAVDAGSVQDDMIRLQERSFVLTSHSRFMHKDDVLASQGNCSSQTTLTYHTSHVISYHIMTSHTLCT